MGRDAGMGEDGGRGAGGLVCGGRFLGDWGMGIDHEWARIGTNGEELGGGLG